MPIAGLYTPLITPFDADGAVDLVALERLAGELIDGGAAGLVALGSTGEPLALAEAEAAAVLRTLAGLGAPLIASAGAADTRAAITRHRALETVPGVVASLAVVPYYVRPSEAGVIAHFRAIATESPVPVLVYDVPHRTGTTLSADTLLELAAIDNIVGMKVARGAIDEATVRLLAEAPDDFAILCGDDAFVHPFMALGAAGAITASSHFATERFAALAAGGGNAGALLSLALALFAEPNPAVIKALLHRQGRIATPDVRLPYANASERATDRAEAALLRPVA